MKKAICLVFIFALCASVWGENLREGYPYVGRIHGAHLNVRAQASEDSEVLLQLNKGDLVSVLGEEGSWFKIEPPRGCTFWVHAKMIQEGWVKTDQVNVRSGPGTHYSSICQVSKNTSIDIVEKSGDWIRILPPLNSFVWVAKNHVRYFSTPQGYATKIEEEKEASQKFNEAEDFRAQELKKDISEISFESILAKYREILEKYPEAKECEKAKARIADAQAKQEVALREIEARQMRVKRAAVRIPIKDPTHLQQDGNAEIAKKPIQVKNKDEQTWQEFAGKLKKTPQAVAPFEYQLTAGFLDSRRLCLIFPSANLNLSPFLGKKVKVHGRFFTPTGSQQVGLLVEKIKEIR